MSKKPKFKYEIKRVRPEYFAFLKRMFIKNIKKENGCWNWTGGISGTGYGWFYVDRYYSSQAAHRMSYMFFKGKIIKGRNTKIHVLHKCDNRKCVNPAHLFLGTHTDNMQDMIKKGRRGIIIRKNFPDQRGDKNYASKIKTEQVIEIKKLLKKGMRQVDVAKITGVPKGNIHNIYKGKSWTHISV